MQAGQQRQNQFGLQNAFMPEGYQNDNYSMRQAANPYFIPGPQDLYITNAPDMWEQTNPMTWQDYTTQMQDDYGHYSPPQEAQQAAAPSTTMDYGKYLNGDIWDTEIWNAGRTVKGTLGNVGNNWSYGTYDPVAQYAPKKPGENATQQDWTNYQAALSAWDRGLAGANQHMMTGYKDGVGYAGGGTGNWNDILQGN